MRTSILISAALPCLIARETNLHTCEYLLRSSVYLFVILLN